MKYLTTVFFILLVVLQVFSCRENPTAPTEQSSLTITAPISPNGFYAYQTLIRSATPNLTEVFDLISEKSIGTIEVRAKYSPLETAFAPNKPNAVTTFLFMNALHHSNLVDKLLTIDTSLSGSFMVPIRYDETGDVIFLVNIGNPAEIIFYNFRAKSVVKRISVPFRLVQPIPHTISPDKKWLGILGMDGGFGDPQDILIFNLETNDAPIIVRSLGVITTGMAFSQNNDFLFAFAEDVCQIFSINLSSKSVSVMDTTGFGVAVKKPLSFARHPKRNIWVAGSSIGSELLVVDLSSQKILSVIPSTVPTNGPTFDATGERLYANTPDGLAIFDGNTFEFLKVIPTSLPPRPYGGPNNTSTFRNRGGGPLFIQDLRQR